MHGQEPTCQRCSAWASCADCSPPEPPAWRPHPAPGRGHPAAAAPALAAAAGLCRRGWPAAHGSKLTPRWQSWSAPPPLSGAACRGQHVEFLPMSHDAEEEGAYVTGQVKPAGAQRAACRLPACVSQHTAWPPPRWQLLLVCICMYDLRVGGQCGTSALKRAQQGSVLAAVPACLAVPACQIASFS